MNDYKRPQHERECPPTTKDPAEQPKPPGTGTDCKDWSKPEYPVLPPPPPCPESECYCPPGPGSTSNCLEELITEQAGKLATADKTKAFKTALEAVLDKAKKASSTDYTKDRFDTHVKEWVRQDIEIVRLLEIVTCKYDCWRCVIDCYVCPKIYELRNAELSLYGDGVLYADVHTLYDEQYWHQRNKDAKQRTLDRIKAVMTSWETPGTTIGNVLKENAKILSDAASLVGSQPGKVLYDLLLTVVPSHLAIAPPQRSAWTTRISKEFTKLCECDTGKPEVCCGPDVGERSIRQRLIGPQPYLIDPNAYFDLICCLVKKWYVPAKEALDEAEVKLLEVEMKITRAKTLLDLIKDPSKKAFEAATRPGVPAAIDCCDFEPPDQEDKPTQSAR
jgi:hypothetical protein